MSPGMATQKAKRVELYTMGTPLPFHFPHFAIPDGVPTDDKIQAVVLGLKNRQAAGATGMRAEHVKTWLSYIWHKEKVGRESPGKTVDTGELRQKWQIFVGLIQTIWDQGEILM
jgi:hypothetical protein